MFPILTYVVSLPETPEKTAKAAAHLKERGLSPRFFNGIHAERMGFRTVFPYEVDHPGSGFNMGFMPTGCWLSHYCLWNALSLLYEDMYLVLEDDVRLPVDWHARFTKALADTPKDFDMLYIGSCCCEGKEKMHISGEVFDLKGPQCTHGYLVAAKALPILLSTQRRCYAPIDISLIFHSHPHMKVYTVLPRIADQFDTELAP